MKTQPPFVRDPYNYDREAASDETAVDCRLGGPSFTQQQFKDECDINVIAERFGLTGTFPENPLPPVYGDFTDVGDYRSALHAIQSADARFLEFPPELRARFQNDPQQLMDFLADPANGSEAVKLGLLKPTTIVSDAPEASPPTPPPPAAA